MPTPKKLPPASEATRDEMTAEMRRIANKLRYLGFHDMADRLEWCRIAVETLAAPCPSATHQF